MENIYTAPAAPVATPLIPIDPVAAPVPTAPSSSGSGFGTWFIIGTILSMILLLLIIVVMGRAMGLFRDTPKETFEVQSGPQPSCNTDESHAIFPAI